MTRRRKLDRVKRLPPGDYGRLGAELGVALARSAFKLNTVIRDQLIARGIDDAIVTAAELQTLGASHDECALYLKSFQRALALQTANPSAEIEISVLT